MAEYDALDVARFWSKVSVASNNDCWPWNGWVNDDQYGYIKWLGRSEAAHRVAYELVFGHIYPELIIRHRCDNSRCCNPLHLISGSHADNVMDRVIRDRSARGIRNGRSKLSEDQVLAIYVDPRPAPDVAYEYGISRDTVRSIKQRRIWRHLWDGAGERT